jgi:hypothetical protein
MKANGIGITTVLGQIEMHPSDKIPGRIQGLQKGLQINLGGGLRLHTGGRQFVP